MKKYVLNMAAILMLTFTLTGCYTVIWDPSHPQLPNRDNTANTDEYSGYYADSYYGGYAYFYDSPWWYDITLPMAPSDISSGTTRAQNPDITNIRSTDNGRGSATRQLWEILNPPSRNSQTGTVSKGTTNSTPTTTTSTGSDTRSSSTTNVRNNNGTRSTEKDKGRGR